MVCARCSRLAKPTSLATPGVKRKSEQYYGNTTSSTTTKKGASTTLGDTGISKSKLLSKSAKNPYAAYGSKCDQCQKQTQSGRKFCQGCAFKRNACAVCGKSMTKEGESAATVTGQRYSAK